MKDFDYIVPNTISYNILVEAYAKNGGDKTLGSISISFKKLTMLREFCWILLFSGGISSFSCFGMCGAMAAAKKNDQEIGRNMMMAHSV